MFLLPVESHIAPADVYSQSNASYLSMTARVPNLYRCCDIEPLPFVPLLLQPPVQTSRDIHCLTSLCLQNFQYWPRCCSCAGDRTPDRRLDPARRTKLGFCCSLCRSLKRALILVAKSVYEKHCSTFRLYVVNIVLP